MEIILSKTPYSLMEMTQCSTRNDNDVMEQEPQPRLRGQSTLLSVTAFGMTGVTWSWTSEVHRRQRGKQ